MNPVKLMYNIKKKVDTQIEESNGKQTETQEDTGGEKNRNYFRFKDSYLIKPRGPTEPLPEVKEG